MAVHGRALRLTAAHCGIHFQGLSHASRCLKELSTPSRRRLIHIDIAFNLIRHITSPSCDKFITGLEKELGGLNLNPGEDQDREKNFSRGGRKEGSKQNSGSGKGKDVRSGQYKDPVTPPSFFADTPPPPKAPPQTQATGVFSSAPRAREQESGSEGMASRHPPVPRHIPFAHPPPRAEQAAGGILGTAGVHHQERQFDENKQVPLQGKSRDSSSEFMQEDKASSRDMQDRIREALADPVFQVIPLLEPGNELRQICESLKEEFNDMLQKTVGETEVGEKEIPISPSSSPGTAPQVPGGGEEGADQQFQSGDRVMIYGLQSRKELNSSHGILLCFDNKAQRWGWWWNCWPLVSRRASNWPLKLRICVVFFRALNLFSRRLTMRMFIPTSSQTSLGVTIRGMKGTPSGGRR